MNWEIVPLPKRGPLFDGAIAVYGEAFAGPPYSDPDRGAEIRERVQDLHGKRAEFQSFAAVTPEHRVVGMTYGYRGLRGQWWHDTVVRALPPAVAQQWLDSSYELVEIAVDPKCQGQGVGSSLINRLLEGRLEATCVLSTRTDSRAHELYERHGFEIVTEMRFANRGAPFYIMGKRLPVIANER